MDEDILMLAYPWFVLVQVPDKLEASPTMR